MRSARIDTTNGIPREAAARQFSTMSSNGLSFPSGEGSSLGFGSAEIFECMKKSHVIAVGISVIALGLLYLATSPAEKAAASIVLKPNEASVVALGKQVYAENCASCHGVALEGQANWRQRGSDGYMPAPPHDETGHTWHHPDVYLFLMTKYGIEKMIGKTYPNNMPAYEDKLSDHEIIAVLSFIKSTWPELVQQQHDQINARANAHSKDG